MEGCRRRPPHQECSRIIGCRSDASSPRPCFCMRASEAGGVHADLAECSSPCQRMRTVSLPAPTLRHTTRQRGWRTVDYSRVKKRVVVLGACQRLLLAMDQQSTSSPRQVGTTNSIIHFPSTPASASLLSHSAAHQGQFAFCMTRGAGRSMCSVPPTGNCTSRPDVDWQHSGSLP